MRQALFFYAKLKTKQEYILRSINIILILLLPALMVSMDSLWIDEANTAYLAMQPTVHAWFLALSKIYGSEIQMPLFTFLAFLWGHLIGTQEWQLRIPNLFYAWAAIGAMWLVGRWRNLPWLPLFFTVTPFLGYYMNEARPYVLIIATSSWMLYGFLRFSDSYGQNTRALCILCVSGILLCASHLLGLFLFGGMTVVLLWAGWRKSWRLKLQHWLILSVCSLCVLPLGVYYGWTLLRSAGGAKLWSVGIGNLLYTAYEFLGLAAFGPPRQILRETMSNSPSIPIILATFAPYLFGLAIVLLLYGMIAFKMLTRAMGKRSNKNSIEDEVFNQRSQVHSDHLIMATIVLTVLLLLIASWIFKWPFWGRHLAYIFPLLVYLVASHGRNVLWVSAGTGMAALPPQPPDPDLLLISSSAAAMCLTNYQQTRQPYPSPTVSRPTLLGFALILILFAGSMNQRFNSAYAKDDYRSACRIARQALAKNQTVWWTADAVSAKYYGLKFSPQDTGRLLLASNLNFRETETLPRPDVIIVSKPDIWDSKKAVRSYIDRHNYYPFTILPAFSIFISSKLNNAK